MKFPEWYVFRSQDLTQTKQNGYFCRILRQLSTKEVDEVEVGKMFKIELFDGTVIDAFDDELSRK